MKSPCFLQISLFFYKIYTVSHTLSAMYYLAI